MTLDVYARALGELPNVRDSRLRIEHAQVLAPQDIPRFAKLGIIPSMQPTHCTSDMAWAAKRVGAERILGAYAWRSLLKTGVHLPLSSDFPGEAVNPFYGIYAAITRQGPDGNPAGGWYPEQRLTDWRSVTPSGPPMPSLKKAKGSIEIGSWRTSRSFSGSQPGETEEILSIRSPALLSAAKLSTMPANPNRGELEAQ
jgi:predicted amidohydrolase YtcJ